MERRRIRLSGIVQGVGFRAFVHGLAGDAGLTGFVRNDRNDVLIEAEGPQEILEEFAQRLIAERPRRSRIDHVETVAIEPKGSSEFVIQASR